MPFQTRRSATLAPERIIKLLIPSMDIWQPPPSPAHSGSGRRRSRNQCQIFISIHDLFTGDIQRLIHNHIFKTYSYLSTYLHSLIHYLCLHIQDLFTYPHIHWYLDTRKIFNIYSWQHIHDLFLHILDLFYIFTYSLIFKFDNTYSPSHIHDLFLHIQDLFIGTKEY